MNIREYIARKRAERIFAKQKDNFWYCGAFFDYQYELYKVGKPWKRKELELPCETFLINPFSDAGGGIPEVGDVLPCIRLDGWVGFYKITKKWRYSSAGSDFASWDDGYHVNLRFHHCERGA